MPLKRTRYQPLMANRTLEDQPDAPAALIFHDSTGETSAAQSEAASSTKAQRNRAIDGWRGIAASCVVFAHAVSYRYAGVDSIVWRYFQRLAGPTAELGVQIFFVISGFIITSLLLREEAGSSRINIPAFYLRRTLRIMPPLFTYLAVIVGLRSMGAIALPWQSLAGAMSFTCNTGLTDCAWWTAHTWSLAVEEQFYLIWPMLLVLVPARMRVALLTTVLIVLSVGSAIREPVFHSNLTSFACIAAGALYACSALFRRRLIKTARWPIWIVVMGLLLLGPLLSINKLIAVMLPILVIYAIFAGNALTSIRKVLESRPLQLLGAGSYSLYLWQQLFLASSPLYLSGIPSVLLLAPVVIASVFLVERPFIRLGHRLSAIAKARSASAAAGR